MGVDSIRTVHVISVEIHFTAIDKYICNLDNH